MNNETRLDSRVSMGTFLRAIDQLNSICKRLNTKGAKDWAEKAAENRIISYQDSEMIMKYVSMRNSIAHDGATYSIGEGDIDYIYGMVRIVSDNADEFLNRRNLQNDEVQLPAGHFR